jgi:3-oxoacyl-[acyl-carrier protein] reductase
MDLNNESERLRWLNEQEIMPGILVLNAGVNFPSKIEDQSGEDFEKTIQVNLIANRDLLLRVLPAMKTNKFGRVVIISSLYGSRVREGRSAYSASKAALEAFGRSAALEYSQYGVLVNMVAPGFVMTDLTLKNNSKAEISNLESMIPLKRMANPEEIASLVTYLVSKKNTYITGQTIYIDGGISIR